MLRKGLKFCHKGESVRIVTTIKKGYVYSRVARRVSDLDRLKTPLRDFEMLLNTKYYIVQE